MATNTSKGMPKAKNAVKPSKKAKAKAPRKKARTSYSPEGAGTSPSSKSKGGRPSKFTPALLTEICRRLSTGEPLAVICRDEHMPATRTVRDWSAQSEEVSAAIARAREEGFDALAAQCIEIADDERHDWLMTQKGEITNEVAIARAKLRVETRLKLLAKWDPKRYGEKVTLRGDEESPVQAVTKLVIVPPKQSAEVSTAPLRKQAD